MTLSTSSVMVRRVHHSYVERSGLHVLGRQGHASPAQHYDSVNVFVELRAIHREQRGVQIHVRQGQSPRFSGAQPGAVEQDQEGPEGLDIELETTPDFFDIFVEGCMFDPMKMDISQE